MRLERVTLESFRSYKKQTFNFGKLTVVVAPNGAGKTNLLEAIYLLSSGESDRANVTEEMIRWESGIGSITGIVEHTEERQELTVVLTRGQYVGKAPPKRRYLVDGVARTKAKFVGNFPTALFLPEDMRLIEGSPPRRRHFLDSTLTMAHPEYGRALAVYESSLRQRNKLLDMIREGVARREQLTYWDQSLIKNGNLVTNYRRDFLDYLSGVKTSFGAYKLEYDSSAVSAERLRQYAEAEVAVGYTLVGPHKDDIRIISNQKFSNSPMESQGQDLMVYGSRGEQRLGVLFLKIAAMEYVEDKLKVKSVVLLDDIFSELDAVHRQEILKLDGERQIIITTAEEEVVGMFSGATPQASHAGGQADIIRL